MTLDLLSIRLNAVGFPPVIRLSVPDAFARVDFGAKKEARALILPMDFALLQFFVTVFG